MHTFGLFAFDKFSIRLITCDWVTDYLLITYSGCSFTTLRYKLDLGKVGVHAVVDKSSNTKITGQKVYAQLDTNPNTCVLFKSPTQ